MVVGYRIRNGPAIRAAFSELAKPAGRIRSADTAGPGSWWRQTLPRFQDPFGKWPQQDGLDHHPSLQDQNASAKGDEGILFAAHQPWSENICHKSAQVGISSIKSMGKTANITGLLRRHK